MYSLPTLPNVCPDIFLHVFPPHSPHPLTHTHTREDIPGAHMVCPTLSIAMETIQSPPLSEQIESVFILGGANVYKVFCRVS